MPAQSFIVPSTMLDLLRAPEGANATVLAASTNQALNELKTAIDIAWVLVSAMFVFFMQVRGAR